MDQQLTEQFEKLSINDDLKDKEIGELKKIDQKEQKDQLQEQIEKLQIDSNNQEVDKQEIIEKQESEKKEEQNKEEKAEEHIIIKGTQRPDGSYRKDTKIRAGYKNPEMIARYVIPQKRKQ